MTPLRIAIAVLIAMAAMDLAALAYSRESLLFGRVCLDLAFALGLWLNSKVARYAAVGYFALSLLSALIPLANAHNIVWKSGLLWIGVIGAASIAGLYLLLFSKEFAAEFASRRAQEPPRTRMLRNAFLALIALTVVAVTLDDFYRLTTTP